MASSLILACILCHHPARSAYRPASHLALWPSRSRATVCKHGEWWWRFLHDGRLDSRDHFLKLRWSFSRQLACFAVCASWWLTSDNSTPFLWRSDFQHVYFNGFLQPDASNYADKRSVRERENSSSALALDIENSAVILAPLVRGPSQTSWYSLQLAHLPMSLLAASFLYCCLFGLWGISLAPSSNQIDGHRARWLS